MSIIKYCGLALLSLSVILILSELRPKLAKLVATAIGVCMLTAAGTSIYPTFKLIGEYISGTPLSTYASTLLKALGVALAVEITSDICRDAGEGSLASRIEIVGKAELLILALPLISELIKIARGMFS